MKKIIFLFILLSSFTLKAQINIQWQSEDNYPVDTLPLGDINVSTSGLTPLYDELNRSYLYVSANQGGLIIYETDPVLNQVYTIDTTVLGQVTSTVVQKDTILYVGLGSIFSDTIDTVGVLSVNIADPANPIVLDRWMDPNKIQGIQSGSGVMRVQGDYLYIGGMAEGLIILNIANPGSMSFVSKYKPDITFPHSGNTQKKVNGRGMVVDDTLVYLCYDAGGMRVINCSDINSPTEINAFANPITFPALNWPRAYNNAVLDDTLLYVAVDYCGLEVWNVNDPMNPDMITHWNPVGCPLPGLWWDAPIHTNELILQKDCDLLFASTGKSELLVFDISDPLAPVAIDSFGTTLNSTATWGVDVSYGHIYLTYVYIGDWVAQIFAPFHSNWSGVKQLSYDICDASLDDTPDSFEGALIYPNPANEEVNIRLEDEPFSYSIYTVPGEVVTSGNADSETTVNTSEWASGIYLISIQTETEKFLKRIMVVH